MCRANLAAARALPSVYLPISNSIAWTNLRYLRLAQQNIPPSRVMQPERGNGEILIGGLAPASAAPIRTALQRAGYATTELRDGNEVAARLHEKHPAAAILHAEIFLELKRQDAAFGFPCIAFGSDPGADLVVAAFRSGAVNFFQSKDSPDEITAAVERSLADGGGRDMTGEI